MKICLEAICVFKDKGWLTECGKIKNNKREKNEEEKKILWNKWMGKLK